MSDLKNLKLRIGSIKKTQKITKAMKMVAASKLRRAREAVESSRIYADSLNDIVSSQSKKDISDSRSLIYGVKNPKNVLLIVVTSDRGLCGGINSNIVKKTISTISDFEAKGKKVKIYNIGVKGYQQLKNIFSDYIIDNEEGYSSRKITYNDSKNLANKLINLFNEDKFDQIRIIYPKFRSAISQEVMDVDIIPHNKENNESQKDDNSLSYEFEPEKDKLLDEIIPKNISVQLMQSFLESYASEQGSRMTAMDNAVNNCEDLIKKLNLQYNRTRQAKITTELVEIISASESI